MLGFYGWRCGTAVSFWYSGERFGHAACHLGDGHLDYLGQPGAMRDGKGGWHDAGDFGKYTGNAGFTLGMMLSAFERHPAGITQAPLPIPERGGALPDYLDEIRWELEWMLKMIYGDGDGRVSHKLTALGFEGFVLPEADAADALLRPVQQRRRPPTSSPRSRRRRASIARTTPTFADRCLAAARVAYALSDREHREHAARPGRLLARAATTTIDPDDRLWAAAEMWETTGEAEPLADVETRINAYPRPPRRSSRPTSTGGRCGTSASSPICCPSARAARRPSSIACARA